jgi:ankyrin repeat protein
MTGVRALIRQAPPTTNLHAPPDNHEIDWLSTNFPEIPPKGEGPPKDEGDAQVWQMMTGWSLGHFENPGLLTKMEISALPTEEKQLGQTLLCTRKRLGLLCRWTGPACKPAISLATAIDGVMNILHPKIKIRLETQFLWPLNVRARKEEQKIWLTIRQSNQGWKSDFAEIEAALSLGLFGASPKTTRDKEPRNSNELDWLRVQEEKTQRQKSILLLGPSATRVVRDLRWWLGPQNGKLKKVSLHKNEDMRISEIEQRRPPGFASLVLGDEGVSDFEKYRIAGFESLWQNIGKPSSGQPNHDSFANQSWCLAAVSEVDLELLYARHMFSTFMWTIARVAMDAKVANDEKFAKVAKEEFPGRTSRFDPKNEESWQSLKLHDSTILELANCVQRAGLGDMEDAYLSLIPPLSKTMLLGSGEVFDIAREVALKEQSKGNWEDAYLAHHLLFQNFIMFDNCDEMAVKATALFVEFFRLLCITTELQQKQVVEEDQEDNNVLKLKRKVYEELKGAKGADKFVIDSIAEFYTKMNWYEFWNNFQWQWHNKDREDICELENLQDFLEQTPLHRAAMEREWDNLKEKLDEDINLGAATDFFNRTALHYAACGEWGWIGATEKIEGLLKVPSIMDAVDCYGMTALHAAALGGQADIVEVLLAHGAGKEKKLQNRTSLHIAAERGHVEVVQKLLDVRADTAVKGPGERTPLHLAVLGCHHHVILKLLDKKGFGALDGSGRTALHLAALSKHVEILLSKQEDADGFNKMFENEELKKATDDNGKTALHLAAERGHRAVVRALLENGAAVDAKDGRESTALHLAAMSGHEGVVRELLKKNADIKMEDKDEYTALQLAARSRHEAAVRVVRMLIKRGAGPRHSEYLLFMNIIVVLIKTYTFS